MSQYRAIKSLGSPYFALASLALQANSQQLPEDGLIALTVQAALHGLPKAKATADECHPLIAFADYGKPAPAANVMALGVTPSGRVIGTTMFGDVVMSPSGTLSGTGAFHNLQLAYDHGGQTLLLTVDGVVYDGSPTSTSNPALPTRNGMVLLFNGSDGISRMRASIRDASLSFFSTLYSGTGTAHYALDDLTDPTPEATLTGTPWAPLGQTAAQWAVTPVWFNPTFYAPLWGTIPQTDPYTGFVWDVLTPYTKRVMPTTQYRKLVAKL